MPVTLSAAKGLARRTQRSFAALRMTGRTALKSSHRKPYLQMSGPKATIRCLGPRHFFKEETISLCHPERSAGSLAGQRSCAALRMTRLNRLRLTRTSSSLKCIVPWASQTSDHFMKLSAHKLLTAEDHQGIIGRNGISWRRDGQRLVELAEVYYRIKGCRYI